MADIKQREIEFCTADGARIFLKGCNSLGISPRPVRALTEERLKINQDGKRTFEYTATDSQVETINTYVQAGLDAAIKRAARVVESTP